MKNCGIVGYGSIGQRHASILSDSFGYSPEKITIWDTQKTRQDLASKHGYSVEEFPWSNKDFDLIVISCATSAHSSILNNYEFNSERLYTEKPLGHKLSEIGPVARKIASTKTKVSVGYMLRQHPGIIKIKSIIDSELLGKPLKYRMECGMYLPHWHPWEDYRSFYMSSVDGGGGALLDISHEIDLAYHFFGKQRSVFAKISHLSELEITCDDNVDLFLEHGREVTGTISLDLIAKKTKRDLRVIFENGEITFNFLSSCLNLIKYDYKKKETQETEEFFELYENQLYIDQHKALLSDGANLCFLNQGLDIMEIIEASRLSSMTGSTVKCPIYPL